MATRPRGYALTAKGERFVALMRVGVIPEHGPELVYKGRRSNRPVCPVCREYVETTPRGYVRLHRWRRQECRGTGEQAVTR